MAKDLSLTKSNSSIMKRSASSGTLRNSGQATLANTNMNTGEDGIEIPKIPRYLSTQGLTTKRKLSASTGNIHGYMAEDYKQLNWPLPKMFGQEKYGFSLIDIDDPRFLKECAKNSKKLIRLKYDLQIVDLEWRQTYKSLNDAEHRLETVGENTPDKTKTLLKNEVAKIMKYLGELQEQKDMYEEEIKTVYERCDAIKAMIKKESDLEDLRQTLENHTRDRIPPEAAFWKNKFNTRSPTHQGSRD